MKYAGNSLKVTCSVIAGLIIIMLNFTAYLGNATISTPQTTMNILMLSLNNILFLTLGLLSIGVATFISIQLPRYKIGRYFSLFLYSMGLSIAIAPCSQLDYTRINYITISLAVISTLFLFLTIGHLTLLVNKRLFCILRCIQLLFVGASFIALTVNYFLVHNIILLIITQNIVEYNLLICAFFSIILMLKYYKQSTLYSQKQIKIISMGIIAGSLLFLIVYFMPMFAVIKIPSNETIYITTNSITLSEHIEVTQGIISLLVFSGVPISIIYLLIQREFIYISGERWLLKVILLILYTLMVNSFAFISTSWGNFGIVIFNVFIFVPILIYICKGFLRKMKNNNSIEVYSLNMLEVLEEERQKLSIYLHDDLLQSLIAILQRSRHSNDPSQAEEVTEQLSKLIAGVRDLSHNLYPIVVEDLGLEQSLRMYIDDLNNDYNIEFHFEYAFADGILPNAISLAIYRTIKELVTNSIKHAACKHITVIITGDTSAVCFKVKDDGKGFTVPNDDALLSSPHMGIYTVKKQIIRLRGIIQLLSKEELGTEYNILIPL